MIYSVIMTGAFSYLIAIMMAGLFLALISLVMGIVLRDMALIGLALSALFLQAVMVGAFMWWFGRTVASSDKWLKDAVAARSSERDTPRYGMERAERPARPSADEAGKTAAPKWLFYTGALLLLLSVFMIAFVWESPTLALIWLSGGVTLYLINRFFVRS